MMIFYMTKDKHAISIYKMNQISDLIKRLRILKITDVFQLITSTDKTVSGSFMSFYFFVFDKHIKKKSILV